MYVPPEVPKDTQVIELMLKGMGVLWAALVLALTWIGRNLISRLKALEVDAKKYAHKDEVSSALGKLERHVDMRADRIEDRMDSQFNTLLDRVDKKA